MLPSLTPDDSNSIAAAMLFEVQNTNKHIDITQMLVHINRVQTGTKVAHCTDNMKDKMTRQNVAKFDS